MYNNHIILKINKLAHSGEEDAARRACKCTRTTRLRGGWGMTEWRNVDEQVLLAFVCVLIVSSLRPNSLYERIVMFRPCGRRRRRRSLLVAAVGIIK